MAPDRPDPEKVKKAIANSESGSRVLKVIYLDDQGESVGEWHSTQLPESPWEGVKTAGLQSPPFALEQLVFLAETHPVHSSALDQKTADIVGAGWDWEALDPDSAASSEQDRDELDAWWESLAGEEYNMHEIIHSVWLDVETVGWGMWECARDPQGVVQRVYHVPAHTVKAHKNGFTLCQARDSRKVWFRRWGAIDINGKPVTVNMKTGSVKPGTPEDKLANDLFVVKRPSRRSTWYGIPGYVSAIGWIALAIAARDDNLHFFSNRREPRWAIILSGLQDDENIGDDLRRAFQVDLKQPYRNVIVPITGKDANVDFKQLSDTSKDGSFSNLSERADKAIMIAHRVPAERLANSVVGALGGNIASEANRVYKEGLVQPSQELLESRLNRFIAVEFPKFKQDKTPDREMPWQLDLADLDIRHEREDLDQAVVAFKADIISLREAREKIGMEPLKVPYKEPELELGPDGAPLEPAGEPPEVDENGLVESEFNDKLYSQLPGTSSGGGGAGPGGAPSLREGAAEKSTKQIEAELNDLLRSSVQVHERLSQIADA